MTAVWLPEGLRAQILQAAATASPRECCGLIAGVREGAQFRVRALHPARNLAVDIDRFDIDPADHLAASKAARAAGHQIIGCYHSHPDGGGEPSACDLAGAGEENFLWLIAAGGNLAAFVYSCGGFVGSDCRISSG
jgi:proteasome lid subunit RPN8/RPN11